MYSEPLKVETSTRKLCQQPVETGTSVQRVRVGALNVLTWLLSQTPAIVATSGGTLFQTNGNSLKASC